MNMVVENSLALTGSSDDAQSWSEITEAMVKANAMLDNECWKKEKNEKEDENENLYYISPKEKFILSLPEQHQGPRFKVSSERFSS